MSNLPNYNTLYSRLLIARERKYGSDATWYAVVKEIRAKYGDGIVQRSTFTKLKAQNEKGLDYQMSSKALYVIADILNVSADYLLGREPLDSEVAVWKEKSEKYDRLLGKLKHLADEQ